MDRSIHLYAQDAHGKALPHTSFQLTTLESTMLGEACDSNGQASFQVNGTRETLNVSADYEGVKQTATIGANTDLWTFTFDIIQEPTLMEIGKNNIPAIIGLVLLTVSLVLAFAFPAATPVQSQLIRSTAALGLGGIASILTGMLEAKVSFGTQLGISATGAAAVYVISYFFVPA